MTSRPSYAINDRAAAYVMIFVNPTLYPALSFTTALDPERMLASVVVRVTYALGPSLGVAAEQAWQVSPEPWTSPVGLMEEDGPFLRGGVDLFVFGQAWAPGGRPIPAMRVQVKAGSFTREALVFGRRVWVGDGRGGLVASQPEPFVSMPLTMAEAFGGTSEYDGLEVPFPDNPIGKGFHTSQAQAQHGELPNIEEPDSPIREWSDTPPTCGFGFCPRLNSARVQNGTIRDENHNILDFRPPLFNQAFVPMIAPALAPGDRIDLTGFSPRGSFGFELPKPPAFVRLHFGERVAERALAIDQVGIEIDAARVFITWRFPFKYVVREREARMCELVTRPHREVGE